jgi:hypothetical protein
MRNTLTLTNPKLSIASLVLAASLMLLMGCGSRGVVDKGPEIPEDLMAMLSIRNPKDFFSDVTSVVSRTDPTGMAIKNLSGTLELYGYPNFAAFDPMRRMGFFALTPMNNGDEPEWFLMVTLDQDAPIIDNMREMGAAVVRVGSWTLAAQNPEVFDRIENIYGFAELLDTQPDEDITLRLFPRVLEQFETKIRAQAAEQILSSGYSPDRWMPYIDWILDEIGSLHAFGMGLDLSPQALKFSYAVEGRSGSHLAEMIENIVHSGALTKGASVQSGKIANFVTRTNPAAIRAYIETLYNNALAVATDADAARIRAVWENAQPLMDSVGPTSFMAFNRLSDPMHYTQLSEGPIDRERFLEAYELFYNSSWQQAMNALTASAGDIPMPQINAQLNAEVDTIEGIAISNLEFSLDPSTLDALNTADAAALAADLNHYFAIHKGAYFAASDLESLKALLANHLKGTVVANNLRDRFQFGENDFLQGNLDLAAIILQTLTELEQNGMASELWIKQLFTDAQLEMLFHGFALDRSLILETEIPVETVIQMVTRGFTLFMMQALSGG